MLSFRPFVIPFSGVPCNFVSKCRIASCFYVVGPLFFHSVYLLSTCNALLCSPQPFFDIHILRPCPCRCPCPYPYPCPYPCPCPCSCPCPCVLLLLVCFSVFCELPTESRSRNRNAMNNLLHKSQRPNRVSMKLQKISIIQPV